MDIEDRVAVAKTPAVVGRRDALPVSVLRIVIQPSHYWRARHVTADALTCDSSASGSAWTHQEEAKPATNGCETVAKRGGVVSRSMRCEAAFSFRDDRPIAQWHDFIGRVGWKCVFNVKSTQASPWWRLLCVALIRQTWHR